MNMLGKYVYYDDDTLKSKNIDITRFLIKSTYTSLFNETIIVNINGVIVRIKMTEDSNDPLSISLNQPILKVDYLKSSSDFDKCWYNQEATNVDDDSLEGKGFHTKVSN